MSSGKSRLDFDLKAVTAIANIARRAMELGASQDKAELQQALWAITGLTPYPRIIVELGCDRGGTLYAWTRVCSRVYGITWAENADSGGAECENHGARVRYGDSHDRESWNWLTNQLTTVPQSIDVLVIDGDHSEAGFRRDLAMYGPLVRTGGLIMCHDILPTCFPAVEIHKVWPGLRERYSTDEIGTTYGWGVIKVRDGDAHRLRLEWQS